MLLIFITVDARMVLPSWVRLVSHHHIVFTRVAGCEIEMFFEFWLQA
jgi:hypothetical protein